MVSVFNVVDSEANPSPIQKMKRMSKIKKKRTSKIKKKRKSKIKKKKIMSKKKKIELKIKKRTSKMKNTQTTTEFYALISYLKLLH